MLYKIFLERVEILFKDGHKFEIYRKTIELFDSGGWCFCRESNMHNSAVFVDLSCKYAM